MDVCLHRYRVDFKFLTDDNFTLYAAKNYDNPSCMGDEEFQEDLARIVYVKRLLRKYERTGELRDRLIVNHIVTFYNVFGAEAATRMMFLRIEPDLHPYLKTFMVFLDYLGERTATPEGIDILRIPLDRKIVEKLRSL